MNRSAHTGPRSFGAFRAFGSQAVRTLAPDPPPATPPPPTPLTPNPISATTGPPGGTPWAKEPPPTPERSDMDTSDLDNRTVSPYPLSDAPGPAGRTPFAKGIRARPLADRTNDHVSSSLFTLTPSPTSAVSRATTATITPHTLCEGTLLPQGVYLREIERQADTARPHVRGMTALRQLAHLEEMETVAQDAPLASSATSYRSNCLALPLRPRAQAPRSPVFLAFARVRVGQHADRVLIITNESTKDEVLTVDRVPDHRGFTLVDIHVREKEPRTEPRATTTVGEGRGGGHRRRLAPPRGRHSLVEDPRVTLLTYGRIRVPSSGAVELTVRWRPRELGDVRDVLHFMREGHRRVEVALRGVGQVPAPDHPDAAKWRHPSMANKAQRSLERRGRGRHNHEGESSEADVAIAVRDAASKVDVGFQHRRQWATRRERALLPWINHHLFRRPDAGEEGEADVSMQSEVVEELGRIREERIEAEIDWEMEEGNDSDQSRPSGEGDTVARTAARALRTVWREDAYLATSRQVWRDLVASGRYRLAPYGAHLLVDAKHRDVALRAVMGYHPFWLRLAIAVTASSAQLVPGIGKGRVAQLVEDHLFACSPRGSNASTSTRASTPSASAATPKPAPRVKTPGEDPSGDAAGYYATLARLVDVVLLLDACFRSHQDAHEKDTWPLLFRRSAPHKSTPEVLRALLQGSAAGAGDVVAEVRRAGIGARYAQHIMDETDWSVASVGDLRDGVRLLRLVEVLTHAPRNTWVERARLTLLPVVNGPSETKRTNSRMIASAKLADDVHNVTLVFTALTSAGFDVVAPVPTSGGLVRVKPEDVARGDRERILGFLWRLYLYFEPTMVVPVTTLRAEAQVWSRRHGAHLQALGLSGGRLADAEDVDGALLRWVQCVVAGYGLRVGDLALAFADGRALFVLAHHYARGSEADRERRMVEVEPTCPLAAGWLPPHNEDDDHLHSMDHSHGDLSLLEGEKEGEEKRSSWIHSVVEHVGGRRPGCATIPQRAAAIRRHVKHFWSLLATFPGGLAVPHVLDATDLLAHGPDPLLLTLLLRHVARVLLALPDREVDRAAFVLGHRLREGKAIRDVIGMRHARAEQMAAASVIQRAWRGPGVLRVRLPEVAASFRQAQRAVVRVQAIVRGKLTRDMVTRSRLAMEHIHLEQRREAEEAARQRERAEAERRSAAAASSFRAALGEMEPGDVNDYVPDLAAVAQREAGAAAQTAHELAEAMDAELARATRAQKEADQQASALTKWVVARDAAREQALRDLYLEYGQQTQRRSMMKEDPVGVDAKYADMDYADATAQEERHLAAAVVQRRFRWYRLCRRLSSVLSVGLGDQGVGSVAEEESHVVREARQLVGEGTVDGVTVVTESEGNDDHGDGDDASLGIPWTVEEETFLGLTPEGRMVDATRRDHLPWGLDGLMAEDGILETPTGRPPPTSPIHVDEEEDFVVHPHDNDRCTLAMATTATLVPIGKEEDNHDEYEEGKENQGEELWSSTLRRRAAAALRWLLSVDPTATPPTTLLSSLAAVDEAARHSRTTRKVLADQSGLPAWLCAVLRRHLDASVGPMGDLARAVSALALAMLTTMLSTNAWSARWVLTSAPEVALVAAECAQIHREHVALLNSACHLLHLLVAGDSTASAMSLGAGLGGRRVAALAQLIRTKRDFRARERGYWETWAKEEEEGDANANLPRGWSRAEKVRQLRREEEALAGPLAHLEAVLVPLVEGGAGSNVQVGEVV